MRLLFRRIISILSHCYYWFSKSIVIKKTSLFFIRICITPQNHLYLKNAQIHKSIIREGGCGNKVLIKGEMINSSIDVMGEGNIVMLASSASIHNTNIIVRGTNCVCDIEQDSTIGGARIVCMGKDNKVKFGKGCMLSDNIEIWATDSHPIFDKDSNVINESREISIGNHVWIGSRVIILKGVHIADESIVGMGSVVTKDIESHTVNAGNPCRCIKCGIQTWDRNFITV